MTKFRKKIICALLLFCIVLHTSCGTSASPDAPVPLQAGADESDTARSSGIPASVSDESAGKEIALHRGDWLTSAGAVDQTWVKDYDCTEWENTPCLYLYAHLPSSDYGIVPDLVDELNHYLHQAGCSFHVQILQCSMDEFMDHTLTLDQIIENKEAELGITVDLHLTSDYLSAVRSGSLLELTDYVEIQKELCANYDKNVWDQLRDDSGRIYGIPTDPIAAGKLGYAYNPQLASLLSIDMTDFTGDLSSLEALFPAMLAEGISPICLDLMPQDYLMLSLAGLETYGEIFAVRHHEDTWTAVDLWQENEIISFYKKLGEWNENGYLSYHANILSQFNLYETPLDVSQYRYRFLQLQNIAKISWFYDVNMADEGGFLETDFWLPDQPAYLYENKNCDIMVVSAKTSYPDACMEFLRMLTLDDRLRLLLYSGIEGYSYMWVDDVQIFDQLKGAFSMGLGIDNDLRFWPVSHFSDRYAAQIEALNSDVKISASLQHPFHPADMEECYEACRQLFEENMLVFLGYYGSETESRLEELHEKLIDAGYLELIDAINAEHAAVDF